VLLCQQQQIGQQTGPAVERALGGNPRQFGKIIAFREMCQNHVGRLTVVAVLKKAGRGFI